MNAEQGTKRSRGNDGRLITARELLDVIRRENAVLQRLEADALLEILPRKELLINRLQHQLSSCPVRKDGSAAGPGDGSLNECLDQIRALNETNRVLIEKSLQYWQDMLNVFVPRTYGKRGLQNMNVNRAMVRGARVNREV